MASLLQQVLVRPGSTAKLARRDPADLLGLPDGKRRGRARAERTTPRLAELQEMLWAEHSRSLLIVLQGFDASGKDGALRRLLTGVNPQGTQVHSFKAPTSVELDHDFLWRIHQVLPPRGAIGVFNRSHYEDVVTTQQLGLINAREAERRCRAINEFERHLTDQGTTILKFFLHISKEEQRIRLQERLDDPHKHWKMDLHDLETRKHFDDLGRLYDKAISATSTEYAPWHVVPADRKWVRDIVVGELAIETLERMNPQYPPPNPDFAGIVVE
jgi:PPK2 family polyphosphate:nucleotide phosphotransferase